MSEYTVDESSIVIETDEGEIELSEGDKFRIKGDYREGKDYRRELVHINEDTIEYEYIGEDFEDDLRGTTVEEPIEELVEAINNGLFDVLDY